jgi:hypothetical protein
MDTITYASIAAIPWAIADNNQGPVVPEVELAPLDVSALVLLFVTSKALHGS